MAHWRTMVQSENFCAADLWDDTKGEYRRGIYKIVKIAQGTVVGQKGRKKGLPFLWLEDENGNAARAPFGSNPTNCTSIANALGTPDAKKWPGKWIGLYVTKVDSPDGAVDAIRIHPKPVEPKRAGDQKSKPITRDEVEKSLKVDGLIDETNKERSERSHNEFDAAVATRKEFVEKAIGRELGGNDQLSEADMRAIEMAEAEEARRGR